MLQSIREDQILSKHTTIVLHYLIRLHEEALFIDILSKIKNHFADDFDGHLWITRQETANSDLPSSANNSLQLHRHFASSESEIGQPWNWWEPFLNQALKHFDTKENRNRSLVYICGPQGLTDRLLVMFKDKGVNTADGHVQTEKWW